MKIIRRYYLIIFLVSLLFIIGCSTSIPSNRAPTINSISPTGQLYLGESFTYDVEATDSDGDTLTYNFISNPVGMTIITATGLISWTPTVVGSYNVFIEVSDGELTDTQSFTLTVSLPISVITPSAPTSVDASDTLVGQVQVSWDSVSAATHYQVYRAISPFSTITPISGWQSGTTYDDTTVLPGVTYYYWVKAATSDSGVNASDYSDDDTAIVWDY